MPNVLLITAMGSQLNPGAALALIGRPSTPPTVGSPYKVGEVCDPPLRYRALCLLFAILFTLAVPARADDWPAPQVREVFSASRDHFVRVTPGKSIGDTVGFAGASKGQYATAEYYRRQGDKSYKLMQTATLLNPVAPVDVFVSNDGRLVTVDNWHNRGYGKVLALHDAGGKLVKAYALADLFSKAEIDAYPHSVSSIHWHDGPVYLNQDQRTLYLMIASGRDLVLGLESGRYAHCETRGGKYLCRASNEDRRWLPYAEAAPQR
jgi:hypothetical protein